MVDGRRTTMPDRFRKTGPKPFRFSRAELFKLSDAGFFPDVRVMLIEGADTGAAAAQASTRLRHVHIRQVPVVAPRCVPRP
jgi:hypothetical protein